MNNAVLIQQAYPGKGFDKMIELTRKRNEDYCKKWKMDYRPVIDDVNPNWKMEQGGWAKLMLIREELFKGYNYVIWLDADAMIYDLDTDLREACPDGIGACWHRIPQLDHWNVGVMYMENTNAVKLFLGEWISKFPGAGDGWFEQGEFNRLAMKSKVVKTLSDRWNATLNVNLVPDAVVLGFHGQGNAKQRLALMEQALKISEQKAAGLGQSEVNNG